MKTVFFITFLILLNVLVYYPVLDNYFFRFDDFDHIQRAMLTNNVQYSFSTADAYSYKPVTSLIFWITYLFTKANPLGYHLLNMSLHISSVVLVFFISLLLFDRKLFAFLAASLFSVNPFAANIVLRIGLIKHPVTLLFYLLSLIFLQLYIRKKKNIYYVVLLFLFPVALLSSEASFTLPILLLLYLWVFGGIRLSRKSFLGMLPYALIFAGYTIMQARFKLTSSAYTAGYYFLGKHVITHYLGYTKDLFLSAVPLHIIGPLRGQFFRLGRSHILVPLVIYSLFVLTAFYFLRKKDKTAIFLIIWINVALLVFLPMIYYSFHYVRLASAPFCIFFSYMIYKLSLRIRPKKLFLCVICLYWIAILSANYIHVQEKERRMEKEGIWLGNFVADMKTKFPYLSKEDKVVLLNVDYKFWMEHTLPQTIRVAYGNLDMQVKQMSETDYLDNEDYYKDFTVLKFNQENFLKKYHK